MAQSQINAKNQNLMGAVAYLLGPITGIVLLLIEKENKYVRFHAMQSTILFGGIFVLNFFLGYIPVLGLMIAPLIGIASLILWIFLMYKAYSGEMYKLPYIGKLSEDQLAKLK